MAEPSYIVYHMGNVQRESMLRLPDEKEEPVRHQISVETLDPKTNIIHVSYQDVEADDPRLIAQDKRIERRWKRIDEQWRSSCLSCPCSIVHQRAEDFALFWSSIP